MLGLRLLGIWVKSNVYTIELSEWTKCVDATYLLRTRYFLLKDLYNSIKKEPFKIPEDDGSDLMHTFFNPMKEGWLSKEGITTHLLKSYFAVNLVVVVCQNCWIVNRTANYYSKEFDKPEFWCLKVVICSLTGFGSSLVHIIIVRSGFKLLNVNFFHRLQYVSFKMLAGGRYKTWKRRWFILNDNCLYYFQLTTVCTHFSTCCAHTRS